MMTERPKRAASKTYRIHDMPARLRPREEMDRQGVEHVTEATLLAVILGSGVSGLNVMDLANTLLRKYGSLSALTRVSARALARDPDLPGIGAVKARVLRAALELARRVADEARVAQGGHVRNPEEAALVLRETARPLDHECFWALPLDAKNRLKGGAQEITKGLLDASLVHPREVFKTAIEAGCAKLIVVHNHPSGDPTPSAEDVRVTRQLIQAGQVVGIEVLDHIILGKSGPEREKDFMSLRESGIVDFSQPRTAP
jgi:DNA repair protein RadC